MDRRGVSEMFSASQYLSQGVIGRVALESPWLQRGREVSKKRWDGCVADSLSLEDVESDPASRLCARGESCLSFRG